MHIERYGTVDSTMHVARSRAASGAAHGTLIVAREQTAGRGRRGRSWTSPPGAGLLVTAILRVPPPTALRPLQLWGLWVGLAVRRAVRALGVEAGIKWPNDLVVGERKLAGVLLEAEATTQAPPVVLAGIGINLAARHTLGKLPADVEARYVGLGELATLPTDAHEACLASLATALRDVDDETRQGKHNALLEEFRVADSLLGKVVRAEQEGEPLRGTAVGISDSGALQVRTDQGSIVEVNAGEVVRVREDG